MASDASENIDSEDSEATESEDSENTKNRQFNESQVEEILICLKHVLKNVVCVLKKKRENNADNRTIKIKTTKKKTKKDKKGHIANKKHAYSFQNDVQQLCNKIKDITSFVSRTKSAVPGNSRRGAEAIPGTSRSQIEEVSKVVVPGKGNPKGHTDLPGVSRSPIETAVTEAARIRPAKILSNHLNAVSEISKSPIEVAVTEPAKLRPAGILTKYLKTVSGISRNPIKAAAIEDAKTRPVGIIINHLKSEPGISRSNIEAAVTEAAKIRPADNLTSHLKAVSGNLRSREETNVSAIVRCPSEENKSDNSNHANVAVLVASKSHTEVPEATKKCTGREVPPTSKSPTIVLGAPRTRIEAVEPENSRDHSKALASTSTSHMAALRSDTTRGHTEANGTSSSQSKEVPATSRSHILVIIPEKPIPHAEVTMSEIPVSPKNYIEVKEPETSKSNPKAEVSGTSRSRAEAVEPSTSSCITAVSSTACKYHKELVFLGDPISDVDVLKPETPKYHTKFEEPHGSNTEAIASASPQSNIKIVTSSSSKSPTETDVSATSKRHTGLLRSETQNYHTKADVSKDVSKTPESSSEAMASTSSGSHTSTLASGSSRNHMETDVSATSRIHTEVLKPENPRSHTKTVSSETAKRGTEAEVSTTSGHHIKSVVPVPPQTPKSIIVPKESATKINHTELTGPGPENSKERIDVDVFESTKRHDVVSETPESHSHAIVSETSTSRKEAEVNVTSEHNGILNGLDSKKRRKSQENDKGYKSISNVSRTLAGENKRKKQDTELTLTWNDDSRENNEQHDNNINLPMLNESGVISSMDDNRTDENTTQKCSNENFKRMHAQDNDKDTVKRARIDHKCSICSKTFHNDKIEEHYKKAHDLHHEIKHNRKHYEHKIQDLDNRLCRRTSMDTNINKAMNNKEVNEIKQDGSRKTTTEETNTVPNERIEKTSANPISADKIADTDINKTIVEKGTAIDLTSDDESELTVSKAVSSAKPIEDDQTLNEHEVIDLCDDICLYDLPEDKDKSIISNTAVTEKNNNIKIKDNLKEEPEIAYAEELLSANVKKEQARIQEDDKNIVKSVFFDTDPNIVKFSGKRNHIMIETLRERRDSHTSRNDRFQVRRKSSNENLDNHEKEINIDNLTTSTGSNAPVVSVSVPGTTSTVNFSPISKNATTANPSQLGLSMLPTSTGSNCPISKVPSTSAAKPKPSSNPKSRFRIPSSDAVTEKSQNRAKHDSVSKHRKKSKKTQYISLENLPESRKRDLVASAQNSAKHKSDLANRDSRISKPRKLNKQKKKHTVHTTNSTESEISILPILDLPTSSSKQRSNDARPFQSGANLTSSTSTSLSTSLTNTTTASTSTKSTMSPKKGQLKPIQKDTAEKPAGNLPSFVANSNLIPGSPTTSISVTCITIPLTMTVSMSSRQITESRPPQTAQQSVPQTGTNIPCSTSYSTPTPRISATISQSSISQSRPLPIKSSIRPSDPRLTNSKHSVPPGTNMPYSTSQSIVTHRATSAMLQSSISKPLMALPKSSNRPLDQRLSKPIQSLPHHSNLQSSATRNSVASLPSKPNSIFDSSRHVRSRDARHSVPQPTSTSNHLNSRALSIISPTTDAQPTQSNSISTSSRRASLSNVGNYHGEANAKYRQRPQTIWRSPPRAEIPKSQGTPQTRPIVSRTDVRTVPNSEAHRRPTLTPRPSSEMMSNLRIPSRSQPSWHIPEERSGIDTTPVQRPSQPSRVDMGILEYLNEAGSRDPRILKRFAAAYNVLQPFFDPKRHKK